MDNVSTSDIFVNSTDMLIDDAFPTWDIRNNRVALFIYCALTVSLVLLSSVRSLVFFGVSYILVFVLFYFLCITTSRFQPAKLKITVV